MKHAWLEVKKCSAGKKMNLVRGISPTYTLKYRMEGFFYGC
ncbi:MAG: hypothetical protein K0Q73_8907 [Paenibacillus sp.]|jgi:hypothetical protein|nr:hypothetical protein [Paenibacillus sp.]